jgi:outer membrane receptor protein involved in Fe transport
VSLLRASYALILLFLLAAPLAAQRARLVGSVLDPSGAAVPGAVVRATNPSTGLAWTTTTSARGEYAVDFLPPGGYDVEASAPNFAPGTASNIRIAVNAIQRVDLTLTLATLPQQTRATALAPLVETETSELGAVLGEKLIRDLPLNGRDFLQLARLTPGVTGSLDAPSSPSGPFNANGQRDMSNNILIDGINVNAGGSARGRISLSPGSDTAVGQGGSSFSLISVDGVAEFKVQTQLYAAEFGGFSGAVVNVNSKGGANEIHGSAYEFLRNSALDANDFFFNANGVPKTPARNNLFGGTLGGPLRRDRTFYFGTFEGLRQRLGVSSNGRVPSIAARAAAPPAVRPLLDLYPLPTGPGGPDGTAPYFATSRNLVGENALSFRVDHRLTDRDDFFARYSFSDSLGVTRNFYLNFLINSPTRLQNVALSHIHRFSALVHNEARFGMVRSANATFGSLDDFGGARAVSAGASGEVSEPGILVFSLPFAAVYSPPFVQASNLFSFTDNLTVIHGRHSLRFGGWIRRVQDNINLKPLTGGAYFFDTVQDVVDNQPSFFFSQVARTGFGIRFTNFAAYAQDDLPLTRRFRLNLGLRYELDTVPAEAHDRFSPITGLSNLPTATLGTPGSPLHNGDHNNFAPRLGFAWQLTDDARTVVRGGAGVFYDLPTPNAFRPAIGPPFKITNFVAGSKAGGSFRVPIDPSLVQTTITGQPPFGSAAVYDPANFRTPYTYHYNLSLQRLVDRHTVVQAAFVGALGRRLIRFRPLNLLDASGNAPNPNFSPGALQLLETTAASSYHALQLHATRRLESGLTFLASYTWAHSLDYVSNVTGTSVSSSFTASNPYNLRAEHASSDFDIRHNFTLAFSYDLPVRQRLLGGWSIQGLFAAQTGLPYTPLLGRDIAGNGDSNAASDQRPNVVPGQPLYLTSSAPPFQVANLAAFATPARGTYGNAGRNLLRSPGLYQLDFGILKTTPLTEKLRLQFRAEFFNLFNHPNFASPAASGNHLLTTGSSFGLSQQMANQASGGLLGPLFSSGGPRSIQFGVKLLF